MWIPTLLSSNKDRNMIVSEDKCKWPLLVKICAECTWFLLWSNNAFIFHHDGLSEDKKD